MKKDEGYLWLDVEFSKRLIRDFEPQFYVGFGVLASYVDNRGEVTYQKAIDGLVAADKDLDEPQARELLTRFIAEGLAVEKGESLALPGFGADFIPNQKGQPQNPRTR